MGAEMAVYAAIACCTFTHHYRLYIQQASLFLKAKHAGMLIAGQRHADAGQTRAISLAKAFTILSLSPIHGHGAASWHHCRRR